VKVVKRSARAGCILGFLSVWLLCSCGGTATYSDAGNGADLKADIAGADRGLDLTAGDGPGKEAGPDAGAPDLPQTDSEVLDAKGAQGDKKAPQPDQGSTKDKTVNPPDQGTAPDKKVPPPDQALPPPDKATQPPDLGPAPDQGPSPDAGVPPVGKAHCTKDKWCWVNPFPMGNLQATRVWTSGPGEVYYLDQRGPLYRWTATGLSLVNTGATEKLTEIWGSGPKDVYAIGAKGTIRHFDGTQWTGQASGTTANLKDIWGTGPGNILVSVEGGDVLHNDGKGWKKLTTALITGHGIWGTGPKNVFVVGEQGRVLSFDGTSWKSEVFGMTGRFNAIWAASAKAIWAVGTGGVMAHYDGTSWKKVASPTQNDLTGIWGTGPSNIFVTGVSDTLLQYDGGTWKKSPGSVSGNMQAVFGSSATDVHAVGDSTEPVGPLLRFTGKTWALSGAIFHLTQNELKKVWAASTTDVYAVGQYDTLIKFDGKSLVLKNLGVKADLYDVWGRSATEVMVADSKGTLHHFDGKTWKTDFIGDSKIIRDIWSPDPNTIYLAAYTSLFMKSWGTWTSIPMPGNYYARAVWGASSTNVYISGGHSNSVNPSKIFRWDGMKVHTVYTGQSHANYWSIWGTGASDIHAVGARYTYKYAKHYDGSAWSNSPIKTSASGGLYEIYGSSAKNIYVVGFKGGISHYDGTTWTPQESGTDITLRGVFTLPGGAAYAVGEKGVILKRN